MIPRFRTKTELIYAKAFPKNDISDFHSQNREDEYHQLLETAIQRGTPVTKDELKAYYGLEAYEKQVAYLKEWRGTYSANQSNHTER